MAVYEYWIETIIWNVWVMYYDPVWNIWIVSGQFVVIAGMKLKWKYDGWQATFYTAL